MSTNQCLSRLASGMSLILLLSSSAFAAGLSGSVESAVEPTMVGISGNCQKSRIQHFRHGREGCVGGVFASGQSSRCREIRA